MKKCLFFILCLPLCAVCLLYSCGGEDGGPGDTLHESGMSIIETGELAAVNTWAFPLQRYGRYWREMKVIGILDHGTLVEPGDSVIQLDPADMQRTIIDWETSYEVQMGNLEKLTVNQSNTMSDIESAIKSATASFELKKIELESSRFESERFRRIKDLEFEQARITFAKEQKRLEFTKIIAENDYKIQQIRVRQLQDEIDNAYSLIPQLTIRTPVGGVFQVAYNWRGDQPIKVGDNLQPGTNMGSVPELKWMKVNTFINENDFLKIRTGQKVAVRLDAMPKVVFDGEVLYIGKLCHPRDPGSRQKVFDVEVRILEPDERLKPGMTVSCEYLPD